MGYAVRLGGRGFGVLALLLALLIGGLLGALIVYLVSLGRRPAPVTAVAPAPAPTSFVPNSAQVQQFEQWFQQMHGATVHTPPDPIAPQVETPPSAPLPPETPTQQ